jgi:hypothetical protein
MTNEQFAGIKEIETFQQNMDKVKKDVLNEAESDPVVLRVMLTGVVLELKLSYDILEVMQNLLDYARDDIFEGR